MNKPKGENNITNNSILKNGWSNAWTNRQSLFDQQNDLHLTKRKLMIFIHKLLSKKIIRLIFFTI